MKVFKLALAAAMLLATTCAAADEPVQSAGGTATYADNVLEVGDDVALAGLVDLKVLRETHQGPVSVVDLRTAPEGVEEAATAAADLGITYHNIPVAGARIDNQQLAALRKILNDRPTDQLLLIHCASGNRAGMLWGALALQDGAELEAVRADLTPVLNKAPAIQELERFAASSNADDATR